MPTDDGTREGTFDRLVATEFETLRRLGGEIVEFEHGWGSLNADLPLVWDANFVAVDDPDAEAGAVAQFADDLLGSRGLAHRRLYVCHTDRDANERLVGDLVARGGGWERSAETYMLHSRPPEKGPSAEGREVDGEEILEARRELAAEAAGDHVSDEAVRQLLGHEENFTRGLDCVWFAAGDPPDGFCQLLDHGNGTGQVEHVGTMKRSRGRGLASSAITAAVTRSKERGDDLTYVVADADDWPQRLYERLGFEPVGTLQSATVLPPLPA